MICGDAFVDVGYASEVISQNITTWTTESFDDFDDFGCAMNK